MACFSGLLTLRQISYVVPTHNKEVDDVLGGEEAWKNVDATQGKKRQSSPPLYHLTPAVSHLPQVQPRPRLLHAGADPVRRRAHDHLLPGAS